MLCYKILIKKLTECVRENMGKALFAFFWLAILETLILSFAVTPMILISNNDSTLLSITSLVTGVLSIVIGAAFVLVLYYGYQVLVARMIRKQYVTLGYLFYGFGHNRKKVFRVALLYALGLLFILGFCHGAILLIHSRYPDIFASFSSVQLLWGELLLFVLLSIMVYVRFMFVWLCLYDLPANASVIAPFSYSRRIVKKHLLHAIGFVLYAGGRYLCIAVSLFVLSFLFAQVLVQNRVLLFMFRLVYIISAYSAVVRMFMAIPVYYDALRLAQMPKESLPNAQ